MNRFELDARNMLCPLPVIRAQERVATLAPGDVLEILCTDPGATNDIPAWCRINDHKVVAMRTEDRDIVITVEVGTGA
ncbi:MAG: sulfurtransferase TusA family protein [Acidiferrobacterales bacterium]